MSFAWVNLHMQSWITHIWTQTSCFDSQNIFLIFPLPPTPCAFLSLWMLMLFCFLSQLQAEQLSQALNAATQFVSCHNSPTMKPVINWIFLGWEAMSWEGKKVVVHVWKVHTPYFSQPITDFHFRAFPIHFCLENVHSKYWVNLIYSSQNLVGSGKDEDIFGSGLPNSGHGLSLNPRVYSKYICSKGHLHN